MRAEKILASAAVILFAIVLILSVELALPPFGSFPVRWIGEEQENSVALFYLENGVTQTGSANVVTSIVWGYRGYDTLGEATILFAAVVGALAVLRAFKGER